jgi:ribosomal protein S21
MSPTIKDLPEVRVYNNNLSWAMHMLRKRVARAGILSDLKIRRQCCTKAARRKVKQRKAEGRRRKILRIQQTRAHDAYNGDAMQ